MTHSPKWKPFRKIPRLNREIIITEKIDGTNGAIEITPDNDILAYSRNRMLTRESDNYGFANWVHDNKDTLVNDLGSGVHYGEWWGKGIQRGYNATSKSFALFNLSRYGNGPAFTTDNLGIVPVLWWGNFSEAAIMQSLQKLRNFGSLMVTGYNNPEGIIVFHTASEQLYKVTLESDEPKGKRI